MYKPYSDVINLYVVLYIYVCNAVWIKYNAQKSLFWWVFEKMTPLGNTATFFIKALQPPFNFLINFGFLSVKLKRPKSARYKQYNKTFIN